MIFSGGLNIPENSTIFSINPKLFAVESWFFYQNDQHFFPQILNIISKNYEKVENFVYIAFLKIWKKMGRWKRVPKIPKKNQQTPRDMGQTWWGVHFEIPKKQILSHPIKHCLRVILIYYFDYVNHIPRVVFKYWLISIFCFYHACCSSHVPRRTLKFIFAVLYKKHLHFNGYC